MTGISLEKEAKDLLASRGGLRSLLSSSLAEPSAVVGRVAKVANRAADPQTPPPAALHGLAGWRLLWRLGRHLPPTPQDPMLIDLTSIRYLS